MKGSLQEISSLKVIIALLALVLTACGTGGEDRSGSVATGLNGTWSGTATSDNGGSVNITLTLSQTGSNVSGTIECSHRDTLACPDARGIVFGTLTSVFTLTMRAQWDDGDTCDSFNGTLEGSTLKGRYSCQQFGGVQTFVDDGSWTAALQ